MYAVVGRRRRPRIRGGAAQFIDLPRELLLFVPDPRRETR
jgi:hypothetical protein